LLKTTLKQYKKQLFTSTWTPTLRIHQHRVSHVSFSDRSHAHVTAIVLKMT